MPTNETPRSFPRPPRGYDGPLYDPMLVEEDFTETVGIARRYALRNVEFTEEDLIVHLARNGVRLYGSQEDWDYLFTDIREQVVKDAAERKNPAQVSWTVQALGDIATYTMVETVSAPPALAQVAELPAPPAREEERAVPEKPARTESEPSSDPFVVIVGILGDAPEGMLRRKELTDAVARRFRLSAPDASDLISAAFLADKLRKVPSRGTTFIAVNNGEPKQRRAEAVRAPEAAVPEERELTEKELLTLTAILDKLAEGHLTTGETIKNLERQINSGFSRDHFRKLLRILEAQRFIRYDSTANYGRARKSPRVHFRGQDTKNRWQANRDGYINRLKKATIY